jgi:TM2 domain-containing membrane protein YozV
MRWRIARAAVVVLLGVLFHPDRCTAQSESAPEPSLIVVDSASVLIKAKKKNRVGAMLRSLAVPGWGQFYNGDYLNAAVIFGAEAGLFAAAAYWDQQADGARGETRLFYLDYRNTTLAWLTGTVLLSAADAYVQASLANRNRLKEKRNSTGAMLRSLAFPGWGQFYNRKYSKALLFFGAETGLLATAIHWNQKIHATDGEIHDSYENNRNTTNWWLLAAIVFSMLDAYVDASLADFDESPSLSLAPVPVRAHGIMLTMKIGL